MCAIDYSSFTWQAFATLTTGLVAAAGAVAIGWRQVGISAKVAELTLLAQREKLFDRRFELYETVRTYAAAVTRQESIVPRGPDEIPPDRNSLDRVLLQSVFLFPEEICRSIDEVVRLADDLDHLRRSHASDFMLDDPEAKKDRRAQRIFLQRSLSSLTGAMGKEMNLFLDNDSKIRSGILKIDSK